MATLLLAEYPNRPAFFAHSFVRLLTKAAVAQQIGPVGFAMLTVIAFQEDVCRYRRAVTYYDRQLMPLIGIRDNEAFARVRDLLVAEGWLHWSRSRARAISFYWVTIPEVFQLDFEDDRACDEGARLSGLTALNASAFAVPAVKPLDDRSMTARTPLDDRSMTAPFFPSPNTSKTSPTQSQSAGGGLIEETAGGLAAPDEATRPQSPRPTLAAGCTASSEIPREPTDPERLLLSRLKKFGLSRAADTLREAIQRGHTAETIDAVVSFAEAHPGHWGGGAIRYRLLGVDLDVPIADGWPKPDPKAVARLSDERRRAAERERVQSLSAPTPPEQQQMIDWDSLEDRYRDRIAVAALADLRAILPTFTRRLVTAPSDLSKPAIRRELLRAFERQDQREAVLT